jgi:hypothetical protein
MEPACPYNIVQFRPASIVITFIINLTFDWGWQTMLKRMIMDEEIFAPSIFLDGISFYTAKRL